ncbi:N-acetyl-gamma-glutamyl-phosphate reductase [Endozoicomonadaceae bacterium StTr2]
MSKIKVGIVGGTGYTGVELLRLLVSHPQVSIAAVTSRAEQGKRVEDMYPSLRGRIDLAFTEPSVEVLGECDLVFFATPNGVAMKMVPTLLQQGVRVIDLAADFRLKDVQTWQEWYGMEHACPELLEEAVYGLPELNREAVESARLVANPGCYPTAIQLGVLPLMRAGLCNGTIIADAKSGVSGAGRQAQVGSLLCEAGDSFKAYAVSGHRHLPEISQGLGMMAGNAPELVFVPHLLPMIRGIHATTYVSVPDRSVDLQQLFENCYKNEPFVDVLPAGSHPETRSVRGSNICRIAVHRPGNGDTVVVLSVIDNLVKGAAGQAVQNFNIMYGLEPALGLEQVPLSP